MAEDSLASHVDCGAGTEAGFCAMTSSYPRARLVLLTITECYLSCGPGWRKWWRGRAARPWRPPGARWWARTSTASGTTAPAWSPATRCGASYLDVLLSVEYAQDQDRPWSWRVYAYKKKQVCNSELYFMRPAFARDTTGQSKGW